jgi:proteasome lid subunit RPN8/RPN11
MDEPEFRIIEHRFDAPFRPRAAHAEYIVFRTGELDVCVRPEVAARLRECARQALPRETGGLLAGRILRDDEGPYVVVTGWGAARPEAGGLGSFNLSPDETETLRQSLSMRYPSADVVGWWHSHTSPSGYSQTDRRNQSMWTHPQHVGLLVFASGTSWAWLYVGPECRGPSEPSGAPTAGTAGTADHGGEPERADQGQRRPPRPVTFDGALARRTRRSPPIWVLIAVVALLAGLFLALLVGKLFSSGPVEKQGPQPGRHLVWSCVVRATEMASCHADSEEPVEWFLTGDAVGSGPDVTFPLRQDGRNVVSVIVRGAGGRYGGGQQLLSTPQ